MKRYRSRIKWRSQRCQGFTLIELLVVIAIIALLAAILFPVFARARENARRSTCQSNLKQMGLGIMQYKQDYDERFPPSRLGTPACPFLGLSWGSAIMPYVKSSQIFKCPSDTLPARNGSTASVGVNDKLGGTPASVNVANGMALAAVKAPSYVIMWFEDGYTGGGYNTVECMDYAFQFHAYIGSYTRHLDGLNLCFVDGHVKWYGKLLQNSSLQTQRDISFDPDYQP